MPIAIDPDARVRVVLSTDKGKAPEPAFFVRPLTLRQYRKVSETDETVGQASNGSEAIGRLLKAIEVGLVGWEHVSDKDGQPIPFSMDALEDVVTIPEARELLHYCLISGRLATEDKKKSESESSSNTESSAKSADQESASTAPA